jgi:hypothetical protein
MIQRVPPKPPSPRYIPQSMFQMLRS